jgi:hypothetical protein
MPSPNFGTRFLVPEGLLLVILDPKLRPEEAEIDIAVMISLGSLSQFTVLFP